jgi:hypothetical protein
VHDRDLGAVHGEFPFSRAGLAQDADLALTLVVDEDRDSRTVLENSIWLRHTT